jgi:hypothetical protein
MNFTREKQNAVLSKTRDIRDAQLSKMTDFDKLDYLKAQKRFAYQVAQVCNMICELSDNYDAKFVKKAKVIRKRALDEVMFVDIFLKRINDHDVNYIQVYHWNGLCEQKTYIERVEEYGYSVNDIMYFIWSGTQSPVSSWLDLGQLKKMAAASKTVANTRK